MVVIAECFLDLDDDVENVDNIQVQCSTVYRMKVHSLLFIVFLHPFSYQLIYGFLE